VLKGFPAAKAEASEVSAFLPAQRVSLAPTRSDVVKSGGTLGARAAGGAGPDLRPVRRVGDLHGDAELDERVPEAAHRRRGLPQPLFARRGVSRDGARDSDRPRRRYCSGKDIRGCGGNYGEGTETKADVLDLEFDVPAIPVIASTVEDFECSMGAIGIALNGVQFYGGAVDRTDDDDPGCELLDVSSDRGEWMGFDFCSGHTGGANGFNPYHYHFPPSCLLDQAGARARGANHRETTSVSHSPQIGWALDGFPVYGPRGANGTEMEHAANGCVGSRCLDFCSGREEALPGVDDFLYRYYVTGPTSDLYSLPSDPKPPASDYPFTFRCYRGCVWSDLVSETNRCTRGSAGVADGYVPRKAVGYTDKYVSAEATAYWYAQNGDDAMAPLCASEPTAAPTTATWAPTTEAHLKICATETAGQRGTCEAAGGECYTAEAHCVGDGGAFLANRCGADCGCCVKQPSPAPTPAPTPAPSPAPTTAAPSIDPACPLVADAQAARCADRGGECYASNHTCEAGRGGVFLANLCGDGAADADEPCGCCVRMPSAAPTWARASASAALADDEDPGTAGFNSLYVILVLTFMSLVIFSLAAVGKFQYDKLKALEHKAQKKRMSTRTRTEMVAAPAMV